MHMSMSYWGIDGYGVRIDDIYKFIDHQKVNRIVRELITEEIEEDDVFDDDTFYGNPYTNFGEFLCELDEDGIFSFDDNGNGECFFLYTPPYPWTAKENEPKTKNECTDKMMTVLRKVCDGHDEDIRKCIDYISDWGCG